MGFSIRFGGWRPVQLEEGLGTLHGPGSSSLEGVAYRFEVWHQMVDGFPGPFRSEGRIGPQVAASGMEPARTVESSEGASFRGKLTPFQGKEVELELEDGRRLPLRFRADGSLLAHARPEPPSGAPRPRLPEEGRWMRGGPGRPLGRLVP